MEEQPGSNSLLTTSTNYRKKRWNGETSGRGRTVGVCIYVCMCVYLLGRWGGGGVWEKEKVEGVGKKHMEGNFSCAFNTGMTYVYKAGAHYI